MKRLGDNWEVFYHPAVVKKDIPKLSKSETKKIKSVIENKLSNDPVLYGIPLRGTLKQFWKLRVSDHRIVFMIEQKKVVILVIADRKEVYEVAKRRR